MTPVDFTRYTPPGVYVEDVTVPIVTLIGAPTNTVTLVGPGRGWQLSTQVITVNATNPVTLAFKGVLPDSSAAPNLTVTTMSGTPLVEDTDYLLVRGTTPSSYTTVARKPASTLIANGDSVVVFYAYADDTYFTPTVFESYIDVEIVYGPALDTTLGAAVPVLSPLSLAARIAFENGAGTLICVATNPATTDIQVRYNEAYAKTATLRACTMLVPIIPAGSDATTYTTLVPSLLSDLKTHCVTASSNGYGRIGLFGTDTSYNESIRAVNILAANTNSRRIVVTYPTKMTFSNSGIGQGIEIGGMYLAAAEAGRLAFQEVRRGLTKTQIYSFVGIPATVLDTMTLSARNTLSAAGVCVVEPARNGTLVVRHGVTTAMVALTDREINVVRTGDYLYQILDEGLNAVDLIGDPIDADTTVSVKATVTGLLENASANNVIAGYGEVEVRQQTLPSGDPTAIEVRFAYAPFLPLNYITVLFSIDLSTGETTLDTNNADVLAGDLTS